MNLKIEGENGVVRLLSLQHDRIPWGVFHSIVDKVSYDASFDQMPFNHTLVALEVLLSEGGKKIKAKEMHFESNRMRRVLTECFDPYGSDDWVKTYFGAVSRAFLYK